MPIQKTLTWAECPRDLAVLAETRFKLNLAFEVQTSSGNSKPNVVFRSQAPAAQVRIQWQPKYALSFTQDLPPPHSIVYLSTPWRACAKGDMYDLAASGFFSKTASALDKHDSLSVVNKYPVALHLIIGMWGEERGRYEPIFVDPQLVQPGQAASYRPMENALWWLDRPLVSGSFFSGGRSLGAVCSASFGEQNELKTTFDMAEGKWSVKT